jgi:hypothetical protein
MHGWKAGVHTCSQSTSEHRTVVLSSLTPLAEACRVKDGQSLKTSTIRRDDCELDHGLFRVLYADFRLV